MSPIQSDSAMKGRVLFSTVLLVYVAIWIFSIIALQIFLKIEGSTETHLSPTQQRISWVFQSPLMIVMGITRALTWPGEPTVPDLFIAVGLVVHAIMMLACARRSSFIALTCVQAVLLTVGAIYFVRLSRLPSGG